MNLDPALVPLLGAGPALSVYLAIKFLDWVRQGRVTSTADIIARLEKAVDREQSRADDAEKAEQRESERRGVALARLHVEQEYTAMLRAQLRDAGASPVDRPSETTQPVRTIDKSTEGPT